MPRRKRDLARPVIADPKYHDVVISKMINVLMRSGKRSVAESAVYGALDRIAGKSDGQPIETFHRALENVRPLLEVRSRRVGGANYQVPTEVPTGRAQSLAIRWIISAANSRGERRIAERLAAELLDASSNRGAAVRKREETHRMAEANKAFAHFRW